MIQQLETVGSRYGTPATTSLLKSGAPPSSLPLKDFSVFSFPKVWLAATISSDQNFSHCITSPQPTILNITLLALRFSSSQTGHWCHPARFPSPVTYPSMILRIPTTSSPHHCLYRIQSQALKSVLSRPVARTANPHKQRGICQQAVLWKSAATGVASKWQATTTKLDAITLVRIVGIRAKSVGIHILQPVIQDARRGTTNARTLRIIAMRAITMALQMQAAH